MYRGDLGKTTRRYAYSALTDGDGELPHSMRHAALSQYDMVVGISRTIQFLFGRVVWTLRWPFQIDAGPRCAAIFWLVNTYLTLYLCVLPGKMRHIGSGWRWARAKGNTLNLTLRVVLSIAVENIEEATIQ